MDERGHFVFAWEHIGKLMVRRIETNARHASPGETGLTDETMPSIQAMPEIEERQFFAVRCCCHPTKLVGFLPLPKRGGSTRLIRDNRGEPHKIEIRPMMEYGVRDMADTFISQEMAVYSEDRGEDFWLTIPGFVQIVTAAFVSKIANSMAGR